MSIILNQRNELARRKFKEWHTKAYSPNLKAIADDIDINYSTFKNWLGGYSNTNIYNLKKIEEFLEKEIKKIKYEKYLDTYKAYCRVNQ